MLLTILQLPKILLDISGILTEVGIMYAFC